MPSNLRRPALPLALAAVAGVALGPFLPAPLCLVTAAVAFAAALRARGRWCARPLAVTGALLGTGALFAARASLDAARVAACAVALASGTGPLVTQAVLLEEPAPLRTGALAFVARADGETLWVVARPGVVDGGLLPGAEVDLVGQRAPLQPSDGSAAALARRGIQGRLRATAVRERAPGRGPAAILAACRRAARALLARSVAPERLGLFSAALLGERGRVPDATRDVFARTGAAHLLSISGLHVSILALLSLALLRPLALPPRLERALVVAALVAYACAVGPCVPTARAAAVGALAFLLPGRGDPWNRLAVALLVVLGWDPAALWDVGLQLSFGSVMGLLLLAPPALRWARVDDPWDALAPARARWRQPLRATLAGAGATFLATAPLLALRFGALPWVALLLGAPSVLVFAVLLGLAASGVLVGLVAPPLGVPLLRAADATAAALEGLVALAGAAPCPALPTAPAPGAAVALTVGAVAVGVAGARPRLLAVGTLCLAALALPPTRGALAGLAPAARGVDRSGAGFALVASDGDALGLGARPRGRALEAARREGGFATVRWLEEGVALGPGRRALRLGPRTWLVRSDGRAQVWSAAPGRAATWSDEAAERE